MELSDKTDNDIQNKTSQPVIEIMSSDDEKASCVEITLYNPCNPSVVDQVAKSYTSNIRMEYNAYRGETLFSTIRRKKR